MREGSKNIFPADDLIKQAVSLIQSARHQAVRQTNSLMVFTYFQLGRLILNEEQRGSKKAAYGQEIIKNLSEVLSKEFGQGFSERNLQQIRLFYFLYQNRSQSHSISQTLSAESVDNPILQTPSAESAFLPISETASRISYASQFPLSWSHYVTLLRIKDEQERSFYEIESAQNNWSVRELKRQFDSGLFERLALSKDKHKVMQLAGKGQIVEKPEDIIKTPYILEFLGLEEKSAYTESDLETAIINKIEHFLLEMGKGFLFSGRQVRFTIDDDDYYVDLVLYNRLLQCFVLVDLKIGKLRHKDIGQMQMYVNYYDRFVIREFENPTIGIIICKDKSESVVEITLPKDNTSIFAREYKLYLPSKEELKELLR